MSASSAGQALAAAWVEAFNKRDVKRLVALYTDDCVHVSPKLRAQRPETGGEVRGVAALTEWFASALARLPSLRYEPLAVTCSESRVVLEYRRFVDGEPPLLVAEAFELRDGRIARSHVYHG